MDYGKAKWKKKRLRILKLDGYRDRVAAMFGVTLEANMVHHIYPAEEYPQWAYETWNLISVNKEITHNKLENRKTGQLTALALLWGGEPYGFNCKAGKIHTGSYNRPEPA